MPRQVSGCEHGFDLSARPAGKQVDLDPAGPIRLEHRKCRAGRPLKAFAARHPSREAVQRARQRRRLCAMRNNDRDRQATACCRRRPRQGPRPADEGCAHRSAQERQSPYRDSARSRRTACRYRGTIPGPADRSRRPAPIAPRSRTRTTRPRPAARGIPARSRCAITPRPPGASTGGAVHPSALRSPRPPRLPLSARTLYPNPPRDLPKRADPSRSSKRVNPIGASYNGHTVDKQTI